MKSRNIKILVLLHLLLMVNSTSGIFSKMAGNESFLSFKFCLFYGVIILLLGIYAVGWQQIIKKLPLTTAFSNKAVTVVWNMIWGALFFKENITLGKIIGGILVIVGVVVFAKDEKEAADE